ncbi:Histidine-containing phosphotransfer protein 1 [Linum perenne]
MSLNFDQGMLDSQFTQIQALQDETNPTFVAEVISAFCNDAERIIIELNKSLSYQNVDFSKVDAFLHQLKGSSSRLVHPVFLSAKPVTCVLS